MTANKNKKGRHASKTHSVHTMQDDLMTAPPPSRFDLRHRKPLSKSKRMEDLRTPSPDNTSTKYPLPSTNDDQTLERPKERSNILTAPITIWSIGLGLGLIFFVIILTIVSSL